MCCNEGNLCFLKNVLNVLLSLLFIMHNIQSVGEILLCNFSSNVQSFFYSVIRDLMTLSKSLSVWFIKVVDVSIIRSFICFFIIITHISNFGHGTENLIHTNCAHINFYLIALLIIIIFFLSVIDGGGGKEKKYLYLSFFLFPVGSTQSLCRPEQHATLERCLDETLPQIIQQSSQCYWSFLILMSSQ